MAFNPTVPEDEPTTAIRDCIRRGAYTDAARLASALTPQTRSRPAVALQIARAYSWQGHPLRAEEALAEATLERASAGERLIHGLEVESLRIFRSGMSPGIIPRVDALFTAADLDGIDPIDLAEAKRIRARILLFAVMYWEVQREAVTTALQELTAIAGTLEAAGHIDEAVSARLTY